MDEGEKQEKEKRVSNIQAFLLVATAILVDLIQVLLTAAFGAGVVLNTFVAAFAGMVFWLWFRLLGVDFISDPKRFITILAEIFLEVIPVLDNLPGFTTGVILTIIFSRIEDKTGIGIPGLANLGKSALASAKSRTLKGGKALIDRQNARRVAAGLNESPRVRPTLEGSRSSNLRGNQAILRRQAQRKGMDISALNSKNIVQNTKGDLGVDQSWQEVEQRALVNKHYDGGWDKFQQKQKESNEDRARGVEARNKAEMDRKRYLEEDKRLNG